MFSNALLRPINPLKTQNKFSLSDNTPNQSLTKGNNLSKFSKGPYQHFKIKGTSLNERFSKERLFTSQKCINRPKKLIIERIGESKEEGQGRMQFQPLICSLNQYFREGNSRTRDYGLSCKNFTHGTLLSDIGKAQDFHPIESIKSYNI